MSKIKDHLYTSEKGNGGIRQIGQSRIHRICGTYNARMARMVYCDDFQIDQIHPYVDIILHINMRKM